MKAIDSVHAAYELLSRIPVNGRNVKLMAMAMQHLENAASALNNEGKEVTDGGQDNQ